MTSPNYQNNTCPGQSCRYPDHGFPTRPWTDPFVLSSDYQQLLLQTCPHFNKTLSIGEPLYVCCNSSQVDQLKKNFVRISTVFSKCPACADSMKRMWCDFTCSSNQHDFVQVKSFRLPPVDEYIYEALFVLSEKFQDEFWECCKRNVLGTVYIENQFVNIRAFLPGVVDLEESNPAVRFKFLNPDEKYEIPGYVGETIPCQESCTCQYCEQACSNPNFKPLHPDYSCKMFGIRCYIVSIIIGGIMLILTAFACASGITFRLLQHVSNSSKQNLLITVNESDASNMDESSNLLPNSDE